MRFEDGTPLARELVAAAHLDVEWDTIRRCLEREETDARVTPGVRTDDDGVALVDVSALRGSRWRVWHGAPSFAQTADEWGAEDAVSVRLPGGFVMVEWVGAAALGRNDVDCRAAFSHARPDAAILTSLDDLERIGSPRSLQRRGDNGGSFYVRENGFLSLFAFVQRTGHVGSVVGAPVFTDAENDSIRIVLVPPDTGTLELVGADTLVGHSFAVRVRNEQGFNRLFYSEDFVAGKYLFDVPIGATKLVLSPRFVEPLSTLATGFEKYIEVRPGVQPVQLVYEPRVRLRVHCSDLRAVPVRVKVVRAGDDVPQRFAPIFYFDTERRLNEIASLPTEQASTLLGPELTPGNHTILFVDPRTGNVQKSVEVTAGAAVFVDVFYP